MSRRSPLRIPALLPQLGLPAIPTGRPHMAPPRPHRVGTPLEVENAHAPHLPPPGGTDRYTLRRHFSPSAIRRLRLPILRNGTVSRLRHIHFLQRQVPAESAPDYNAFSASSKTTKPRITLGPRNTMLRTPSRQGSVPPPHLIVQKSRKTMEKRWQASRQISLCYVLAKALELIIRTTELENLSFFGGDQILASFGLRVGTLYTRPSAVSVRPGDFFFSSLSMFLTVARELRTAVRDFRATL